MTASSVTSLSDSPPSLLVCVNKEAAMQPLLTPGQAFAVNILGDGHETIANKCAQKETGQERFDLGDWLDHPDTQAPYLASAQGVFICSVDNDNYIYGTHQIVIGRLLEVILPDVELDPLLYWNGDYQRLDMSESNDDKNS